MNNMRRGVVGIGLVCALGLLLWGRHRQDAQPPTRVQSPLLHPVRPVTPPEPGRDVPSPTPHPELPADSGRILSEAYAKAIASGDERPGDKAFRATIDAFMAHNKAFAEAQAAEEGVSLAEVHEFTYFGFLALQTQQWPEVEAVLGHPLSETERAQAEQLMHDTNATFKAEMRKLVAEHASEAARKQLFADTQARYKRAYFAITGMNDELLDDLLAGDPSRPGAPSATPIPDRLPPPPPPGPSPQRPEHAP